MAAMIADALLDSFTVLLVLEGIEADAKELC